jgi:hypothetical protein
LCSRQVLKSFQEFEGTKILIFLFSYFIERLDVGTLEVVIVIQNSNSIFSYTFENDFRPGAVAHACNTGYSGGRDQENHSLKPA